MTVALAQLGTADFLVAVFVAALISLGMFALATRHGSRHATAWGVGAFLAAGLVVPLYAVLYLLRRRGAGRGRGGDG